jgi:hypothetical protein
MSDDRPVDVRLALALGWTGLHQDERGLWWADPPTPWVPKRSSDYAWCGEGAELNEVALVPFWSGDRVGWNAYRRAYKRDPFETLDPSRNVAYCEWLIAAIAAGVTVRLPGGRVING